MAALVLEEFGSVASSSVRIPALLRPTPYAAARAHLVSQKFELVIYLVEMKLIALLLLALMISFVTAQGTDNGDGTGGDGTGGDGAGGNGAGGDGATPPPEEKKELLEKMDVDKAEAVMDKIHGIGENKVWIIQFYDTDKEEDCFDKLKECLGTEKYNDDRYQEMQYYYSEVDINNKKFDKLLTDLDMDKSSFQATYPAALFMRKREGLIGWGNSLSSAICSRLNEVVDGTIFSSQ